jgi:hypothetical protein
MILHINDNRLLREIQMDFSKFYPYLRMEFFHVSTAGSSSSSEPTAISPYVKVGSVRRNHHQGAIYLFPNTTVKDLEDRMNKEFNLGTEIYHYTKAGWLQTDAVDMATLNELNDQGRAAFNELHNTAAQAKNLF